MDPSGGLGGPAVDDAIVMEDDSRQEIQQPPRDSIAEISPRGTATLARSPMKKTRSMSEGEGTPSKLSPSPHIIEASRRTSKDDSIIRVLQQPVTPTPRRLLYNPGNLAVRVPTQDQTPPPPTNTNMKPVPLSPKLDHSQIYASPTNILPRRSRGLDFSRAATSLHHSTLAGPSSPESSPSVSGGRSMKIPGRRGDYGGPEQTSSSLWSIMGNQEKMNISSSLGSTQAVGSDSSSSSDDDDLMDEDMDDAYVTTPQVSRATSQLGQNSSMPGPFGSPAMSSLMSFQQRQRPRRHSKKKNRGPFGLGFGNTGTTLPRSPPNNHPRRESISWQANQLHISNAEAEDGGKNLSDADSGSGEGQRNVVRRAVTRRGNLLPKTRTFARIRAALMEEGAPAEAETRREAEVVKQVRESDADLEPRIPAKATEPVAATAGPAPPPSAATPLSSPCLKPSQEGIEGMQDEDMMGDLSAGLSSTFKQQAIKNSKGKMFWDTFSESSSVGGPRTTPPPSAALPRGSSSGISDDLAMDSPSLFGPAGYSSAQNRDSAPPSAAEITRRINNKRRRDDDFDPGSFKRRAVSPGMSVHNSPIMQSPLQRDSLSWGGASVQGSNGGDTKAGSSAQSDSGSVSGTQTNQNQPASGPAGRVNGKARVGLQGMVDTNDGIMRMSIE